MSSTRMKPELSLPPKGGVRLWSKALIGRSVEGCVVREVYDGDTFTVEIPLPELDGPPQEKVEEVERKERKERKEREEREERPYAWKVRLIGLDTPELRTRDAEEKKAAKAARAIAALLLLGAERLVWKEGVWTHKPRVVRERHDITMKLHGEDKYGRMLVSVRLADGRDLTTTLCEIGVAKAYDGGTKTEWAAKHYTAAVEVAELLFSEVKLESYVK